MVKERVIRTLVVLVGIATLTAGSCLPNKAGKETAYIEGDEEGSHLEGTESFGAALSVNEFENNTSATEPGDSFALILDKGNKDLFAGYSVDESFLSWVWTTYGKEKLMALANNVSAGNTDVNQWYELTSRSIHVLWMEYCKSLGYSSYALNNVNWRDDGADDKITMDFIGDINFDENWYTTQYMDSQVGGFDACISEDIRAELQSADITMINNEFTYSNGGEALAGKDYCFRANPSRVNLLKELGTDIASLGNNHAYDYGENALLDTMQIMKAAGISYVGAGKNIEEAMEPQYFIANGRKIAIVSATQIEMFSNFTKEATEEHAGVLKARDPEKTVQAIQKASKESDYVIVYIHWGTEGNLKCSATQEGLAQTFVEAGADVIIGNHPHRLQGTDVIDEVPVVYSLGNFWFSTGTLYTAIAQIQIDKAGAISLNMIPCIQKNLTTSMITDENEKNVFYEYMQQCSGNTPMTYSGLQDLEGRTVDIVGNLE